MKTAFTIMALTLAGVAWSAADWKPVPGAFELSRWAAEVTPANVLPEYPRPQMARKEWMSLNGLWNYSVVAREAPRPESYQGEILVPFPIEAPLSGVGKLINSFPGRTYLNSRLWYRREFEVPASWQDRRVLLHFGAVDWEATVYLNGKELGVHRGGYDGFSFDVTDALARDQRNELLVAVWDPTVGGGYPRGKQVDRPDGIWYTPCTGIWQTVWLEPVPVTHIASLKIVPDVDKESVRVTVNAVSGKDDGQLQATVEACDGPTKVGSATGQVGDELVVRIPRPKFWWPDAPFLYDLRVTVAGQRPADVVTSYFGMRKVSVGPDRNGITRILLNDRFVLHNGLLDQGFWPDGIYTAPTDAALRYDIEAIKQLGFNMSRKHLKIEPERWFYWADKLGLLVWQDMPCSADALHAEEPAYPASRAERQSQFGVELQALIQGRGNHPCIVSWILFNEGMGLRNTGGWKLDDEIRAFMRRMVDLAAQDPTRVINAESGAPGPDYQGWNPIDIGVGHVMDAHCYGTTRCITPTKDRASVIGEYGYDLFLRAAPKYRPLVRNPGVSGLVWTQITHVENEVNGLLTYDRKRFTEDPQKVAEENANTALVEKLSCFPAGDPLEESILNTRPSNMFITPDGRRTATLPYGIVATTSADGACEYIHVLRPPAATGERMGAQQVSRLKLPPPADFRRFTKAVMLRSGREATLLQDDKGVHLDLPGQDVWDPVDTVIKLTVATDSGLLSNGKAVTMAGKEMEGWPPKHLVDGDKNTCWSSLRPEDIGEAPWVMIDFGAVANLTRIHMFTRVVNNKVGYNFPVDFEISVSSDGKSFTKVMAFNGYQVKSLPRNQTEYVWDAGLNDYRKTEPHNEVDDVPLPGAAEKRSADYPQCFVLPAGTKGRYLKIFAPKVGREEGLMQLGEVEVFGSK